MSIHYDKILTLAIVEQYLADTEPVDLGEFIQERRHPLISAAVSSKNDVREFTLEEAVA
ncbi:hypothetical protein [Gimesia maris]|uniref:hypothetical protein n=1 Tax=Gimesia maris TaxID=122 RepID=UPI0030D8AC89|tara:strand:- start:522 stop:698 length:177 start_codon:yes stop_codon:yes gene_type:complete